MRFTLLFYTDGWEVGPTVELLHIPSPGSVIWVGGRRRDEDGLMYYVDNVMYPEQGMEREDVIYLYVRPYNGYAKYAPKTETDRMVEKLDDIKQALIIVGDISTKLLDNNNQINEQLSMLRKQIENIENHNLNASEQVLQILDAIEDGQQDEIGKLDDIALTLEQIKEQNQ